MKPLDRRTFALRGASLAGSLALAGLSPRARAQGGAPVEGRDYAAIAKPVATAGDGRIEVLEFFWYGCPHCFALEPKLQPWITRQPADVAFRWATRCR
jgi:thiol:disulfide interchange protein DsbA